MTTGGPALYLGVDGGGTRCRARLEAEDGTILGHGLAGPASVRFGIEAARDSVLQAARGAFTEAGLREDAMARAYAGIGLAGTGQRGARNALEAWRHPFAAAWFEGDGYLALLGAFGGDEGGVVVAGTGSIGISYQGKTLRIGGYGFPVSDEGSGADLGLNGLRFALRTLDGRAEPSAFSAAMLAPFGADAASIMDWLKHATATDYAALAPIVVQHAEAGDAQARALMQNAAAQIGALAEALRRSGAPRVALVGGLAEPLRPYMDPALAAQLARPLGDAMAGGILLARTRKAEADAAR